MPGNGGYLAPCPRAKIHLTEKPNTRRFQENEEHSGRAMRGYRGDGRTHGGRNPRGQKGPESSPRAAKVAGHTVTVHVGRRMHMAWGAETSGRGWRVAGAGDVQVGGALHQERRWRVGANIERDTMIIGF